MERSLDAERRETRVHGLLIDPYAGSREGLRVSLEAEGCLVEATADAPRALALMRAGGFDLAVIDLDFSPVRGVARSAWELARLFRDFNTGALLVLLAAELRRKLETEAAYLCPALVLEKPIDLSRLRAVVRELQTGSAQG